MSPLLSPTPGGRDLPAANMEFPGQVGRIRVLDSSAGDLVADCEYAYFHSGSVSFFSVLNFPSMLSEKNSLSLIFLFPFSTLTLTLSLEGKGNLCGDSATSFYSLSSPLSGRGSGMRVNSPPPPSSLPPGEENRENGLPIGERGGFSEIKKVQDQQEHHICPDPHRNVVHHHAPAAGAACRLGTTAPEAVSRCRRT